MNITKANTIIQQIDATIKKWNEFAEEAKVEKDLKERIGKSMLVVEKGHTNRKLVSDVVINSGASNL
ncbi:hypothetical protein [Flavobacterium sp. ZS1P14]|uniref:hypothetical protein n=1 Tax=Flavobacterium sp. ZS1P14 TaxID=3401729 RepID=UPI003AAD2A4B